MPDLEELGVLVHDVEEDGVDVAAEVRVQVLLLLQGLAHLKQENLNQIKSFIFHERVNTI